MFGTMVHKPACDWLIVTSSFEIPKHVASVVGLDVASFYGSQVRYIRYGTQELR